MSRSEKVYFVTDGGLKIEIKPFSLGSLARYCRDKQRLEIAKAMSVPVGMLWSCTDELEKPMTLKGARLTNIEVPAGECLNVALTDELRSKGSIDVTFKYDEFKYDEVSK